MNEVIYHSTSSVLLPACGGGTLSHKYRFVGGEEKQLKKQLKMLFF